MDAFIQAHWRLCGLAFVLFVAMFIRSFLQPCFQRQGLIQSIPSQNYSDTLMDKPLSIPVPSCKPHSIRVPSCAQRLGKAGGLPGLWTLDYSNWLPLDPECAAHWDEVVKSKNDSFLKKRTLWFLGDSVLRDLAVSLEKRSPRPKRGLAADSFANARLRAKTKCVKGNNAERRDSCQMSYGEGSNGRFVWFQWLSSPHRIPWGLAPNRGSPYHQQEVDVCCQFSHSAEREAANSSIARDTGLRKCLAVLFRNASARDVLVLRSGLNYPLYAPHVAYETASLAAGQWPVALETDLSSFLWTVLPQVFPGTVVVWQLDPALAAGGLHRYCGEGPVTRAARMIPAARAIQARVVHEAIVSSPLAGRLLTIDPSNIVATESDMKSLYTDCLHHGEILNRIKGIALMAALRAANMPV